MRTHKIVVGLLVIATALILTACQAKKPANLPAPANQQSAAELPAVQMKAVKLDDPSTYPPENFIRLSGADGQPNGDAYRTYLQNKFVVKIAATLPQLKPDEAYGAFLINPGSGKFIPLGDLSQKEAKWVLDYSSDRDGKGFTRLFIVSGKNIVDPDKGKQAASGDFPN